MTAPAAALLWLLGCSSPSMATPAGATAGPRPAMPAAAAGSGGSTGSPATGAPAPALGGSGMQVTTADSGVGPGPAQPGPAADAAAPPAQADAGGGAGQPTAPAAGKPVLYWLDIFGNAVWRANADGSDARAIATGNGISAPDGVSVDVEGGYLFWTNMGSALGGANLGTVQRAALDGTGIETIVPVGVGNTFKQLAIDGVHHKLYWCDREGAKLWRANMDGSQPETLASGHGLQQPVGIALDVAHAQLYFSDKDARKIMRAGLDLPAGQTDANRTDIEDLVVLGANTMPIDLELDLDKRQLYWTDRSLGTVQRAGMDLPAGQNAVSRSDVETLVTGLSQPIGITLDLPAGAMYFSDLSGNVWRAGLDGSGKVRVTGSSAVTGITLVHLM